jgi:hypothetical protein
MQIIKDFQATWSLWAWKKIAKLTTCNQKAIWLQNLVIPMMVTSRNAETGREQAYLLTIQESLNRKQETKAISWRYC